MEASTTPNGDATASEARPLTRREAMALEQAGRAPVSPAAPVEQVAPAEQAAPVELAPAPEQAQPTHATQLQTHAHAHVAPRTAGRKQQRAHRPKKSRQHRAKQARSTFSIGTMSLVALLTVATTVPADAMLSASAVQARQIAFIAEQEAEAQLLAAGEAGLTVSGEIYAGQSLYDYALASGVIMAPGFTNNPNGTVQWPFAVGVPIGARYGETGGVRYEAHSGLDFNPGEGAPVQAIADGVVVLAAESNRGLGHVIGIQHEIKGEIVVSIYAHLLAGTMRHRLGDTVKVGERVGNVGNTGFSTGPHLHFEIRLGSLTGEKINPLPWLEANTN